MYLNRGYELEDRLLHALRGVAGATVCTEKDLTRSLGWDASAVDFMIDTKDRRVFMQVKYLSTRRKESVNIQKFLNSMKYVNACIPPSGKTVTGLWVSKLHPFNDNVELLHAHDVIVESCFDSMDALIRNTMGHFP